MKRLILYFPIALLLVFVSCSKEAELKKSVWISDEDYPDLPAYTEWGYNTFGAYFDMVPFISNSYYSAPAKMINTGGKTSFILKGSNDSHSYYYYNNNSYNMSLAFDFYGFDPKVYTDLIYLNDLTVDLTGATVKVRVITDSSEKDLDILNGSIFFKRAQNLLVDKKLVEVILSGTFEFQALINNEPVSVSEGRFDIGIGKDNFFKY
ncbi:MAG: hypothetical protein NT092_12005 [Bacteroidia bacterium]|nr:hypothetical protein [Bacteroidia bacterium]